ncbi:hypothetical protein NL676_029848 [Syzygium grande]|nr:hypothetical protein NL676_029848 [Syzygium grande]
MALSGAPNAEGQRPSRRPTRRNSLLRPDTHIGSGREAPPDALVVRERRDGAPCHHVRPRRSSSTPPAMSGFSQQNLRLKGPPDIKACEEAGQKPDQVVESVIVQSLLSPENFEQSKDLKIGYGSKYMPVLPLVLEGIETGWSSYICNRNSRDIIANLRRLSNGEMIEPMDPWYRAFSGAIQKTSVSYPVYGMIEEVDDTMLRITELPIR